MIWNCKIGSIL